MSDCRPWSWAAGLLIFAALIAGPSAAKDTPFPFQIGGPFTLSDHTGQEVTEKSFAGQFTLIYFGYTFCPDICPTNLQVMGVALDALAAMDEKAAAQITPVFISIDPERDKGELLKEYVSNFHPRMVGLSGTGAQTKAATQAYRIHAIKVVPEGSDPEDYLMSHSSITFLMGPDGQLVTLFPHDTTPEKMTAVLRKYVGGEGS